MQHVEKRISNLPPSWCFPWVNCGPLPLANQSPCGRDYGTDKQYRFSLAEKLWGPSSNSLSDVTGQLAIPSGQQFLPHALFSLLITKPVFYARSATDSQDFKTVYRAAHSRFGYRFVFCFCFYKKSLAWKARGRRLPAMGAQLLSPDFLNSCRAIMSIDSDDLISLFFHCLLFQSHTLTCRLWVCRRIE